MNIPKFLKQRREELLITQDTLAKCIGFKEKSSIHKLEKGIREWRLKHLIKACKCLNLELQIKIKEK